jgi:4-amino-4-deoxy-L-arabinose transferase-like glycosyltransferase
MDPNQIKHNVDPPSGWSFRSVAGWAVLAWVAYGLAGLALRPPFPVDETRYLTVAWEMHVNGEWILPTLNFAPYDHKPPMLFWLINLVWSIFGVSRFAAGLVPVAAGALGLVLTGAFVRRLWPEESARDRMAAASVLLMAGGMPLLVYGPLMMFDHLLSVFVLGALMAVWGFYRTARWSFVGGFALAAGLGILTKGPVMLLYVAFPVLLAPWWGADWRTRGYGWGRWYGAFLGPGLGGALALALAWAVPAAMRGGPEYRDMILWGQTAGRMVQAFDHDRPLWWYVPFLPLGLLPWVLWPGLWRAVRARWPDVRTDVQAGVRVGAPGPAGRFLVCWVVPTLVCFSLISGKQIHYLIPLTPAVWIACGFAVGRTEAAGVLRSLARIAAGMGALFVAGQAVSSVSVFRQFDLVPVADVLAREGRRPLAWVRNYQGELGFVANLTEPLDPVEHEDLPAWFADHPDGVAVVRYRRPEQVADYDLLYTTPTQYRRRYAVVRPVGSVAAEKAGAESEGTMDGAIDGAGAEP